MIREHMSKWVKGNIDHRVRAVFVGLLCLTPLACATEAASPEELTYCDIQPIMEEKCVRCHTEPREHGEPFTLRTYEEVEAELERIERAVRQGFMPYTALDLEPPVQDLTEEEREMMLTWLESGAPSGGCE